MKKENAVVKQNCHSRGMLSGIFDVLSRYVNYKKNTLFIKNPYVGDPRQNSSGMTPSLTTAHGFTLIELLVVVLIIGILAAVAVPQYQKAVIKSRYAKLKMLVKSVADAEDMYYLANGKYTIDFSKLDVSFPADKLDTSTQNVYYYDWGFCSAGVDEYQRTWFGCTNSKIKMRYHVFLSLKNRRTLCYINVVQENSPQAKICRQETGKDPNKSTYFWTWDY